MFCPCGATGQLILPWQRGRSRAEVQLYLPRRNMNFALNKSQMSLIKNSHLKHLKHLKPVHTELKFYGHYLPWFTDLKDPTSGP